MPTIWKNSHLDQLQTLNWRERKVQDTVGEVRQAIEPLILPVAAKVLAAIAADVVAAIEARNDRPDVKAARTALENAIKLLEEVDPDLQG